MSDKLLDLSNVLLISGQQQNVGKTTFACRLIAHFSRGQNITAIKITPHFHKGLGNVELIKEENGYHIYREKSDGTDKDTSRMLKAGAKKAYLLLCNREGMFDGFKEVLSLVPDNHMIICESARIRDKIKPGIFLFFRQLSCKDCSIEDEKMFNLADRVVMYTINGFDFRPTDICIENGNWKFVEQK